MSQKISFKQSLFATALVSLVFSSVQARDQLQIVGSSTVYPFATLVAENFGSSGRFKTPVIESTGTGGGMKLFCQGNGMNTPDIINASRAIKKSEMNDCLNNGVKDIMEVNFGNDGIAFANSIEAPHYNFSRQQLWQAMAEHGSKPTYWNEIDASLPTIKIAIMTPPPTSGTRDAWNAKVMKKGCPDSIKKQYSKKACKQMREDGAVIEAGENDALMVQKLEANKNLFGIFGFSYLGNNDDRIQGSTIEHVSISLETIQSYEYPISRPLFFYVKKSHIKLINGMQQYLNEFSHENAIGEEGYLADAGLVPLSVEQRAKVREVTKKNTTIPLK